MSFFNRSNIILILKEYKLSIFSAVLFFYFIVSNLGIIIESFQYNPDVFTNKILFFSIIFITLFLFHIIEIIKRIKLSIKQLGDEKNISFILETTGDVLYHLVLPQRTYSYMNPAIKELIGYNKEELNSIGLKSIVKKAEKIDKQNMLYSDFNPKWDKSTPDTYSAEYLVMTKDGKYKWIEDISYPKKSKSGETIGTVGILRDITKRKNYFSMINEELNSIKKYLEISEVIFLVFDKDQNITFANKKASQVLGYSEIELIGKNWYDSFTPIKNREKKKKAFTDIFTGLYPIEEYQENVIINRFGDEHIVGWHDAVVRDNRNNITAFISSGIDITEQKKIEESLRFERYLLQTLMDNIPDGIFFKDKEHKYIRAGKGFGLIGLEPKDKTDFDIFAKEMASESFNEEEEILNTGKPIINKIEKLVYRNGLQRWVSTTKVPIYDSENNISGIAGITRDFSEIKKAEDLIRENEQRWRYLLENSPISIVIISRGKILYVNSETVKIVGAANPEQIIGKSITEFIPPVYLREFFRLNKVLADKDNIKIPHTEGRIYKLNKEVIEVEGAAIPVNYAGKDSVQVIFRDISERKKQEQIQKIIYEIFQTANSELNIEHLYEFIHKSVQSLMKAENFYIALYDQVTELVTFVYHVDNYNKLPATQLKRIGLSKYTILSGKSYLLTKEEMLYMQTKGEAELFGEPSKIWLGVPLKIQNKSIGVIAVQDYESEFTYGDKERMILETISYPVSRAIERKMVETEREELINKLKEINLSKDRLFSVISHDLRSPFNALLGLSGILASDYQKLSDKDRNSYLNSINQTARNLYALVNNLLEFSRFQTGKFEFNPKNIDYKETVNKTITLLEGNAVSKNITLLSNLEKAEIFVDESMFGSIIQNLLSNAIKFTEPGGIVEIAGKVLEDEPNKKLELRIKDRGIGMSQEFAEDLFRANRIFSTPGTSKEPGSGLGLVITKDYIEKNNGSITVKSKPGAGTEFTLLLPLSKKITD